MLAALPDSPRAPRDGPGAQAREASKDLDRSKRMNDEHDFAASPKGAGLGGAAGRAESTAFEQPGRPDREATVTLLEAEGHGRIPRAGYKAALQRTRPQLREPLILVRLVE